MSAAYASSLAATVAFVFGLILIADVLLGGVNPANLEGVFRARELEEDDDLHSWVAQAIRTLEHGGGGPD